MGWEKRGSQKVYYRSKRVNGRVIKEYYLKDARNPRLISDSVKKQSVANVT